MMHVLAQEMRFDDMKSLLLLQKRPHLLRFFTLYQGAKKVAIGTSLLAIWWGSVFGPLREVIFSSLFHLLGFVLVVLFVPVFFFLVFPPPFVSRYEGETAWEELDRERVKLVLLLMISAVNLSQLFFLSEHGLQIGSVWYGYVIMGLYLSLSGWILRRRQKIVLQKIYARLFAKRG